MLLLHIGPHKTATSYIQNNLFNNREFLAARGWIYPELGTEGMTGHHEIANNMGSYLKDPLSGQLRELGQEVLANGQNLVLSGEGFCRWSPEAIATLAGVLGQEQVHLVFVVRDPFDVLYSYWAEEVKQGYSCSFADQFIKNAAIGGRSRLLNPMQDLAPHIKQPNVRVSAVPYELLKVDNVDIYDHFCQSAMDITDVPKIDDRYRNVAYPIERTEILRLLTQLRSEGRAHIGSGLRHRFMAVTVSKERSELEILVREHGAPARRVVRLDGMDVLKKRLELGVLKGLEHHWTYPLDGKSIYKHERQNYRYYDSFILWQIAPIREAIEALLEKL